METLAISILFVYGIAYLVAETDGPFGIFYRFRKRTGFGCFPCQAVWFAAFASFATARDPIDWFVHAVAIAGGAIFLYSLRRDG